MLDYNAALDRLRLQVEGTNRLLEFLSLESRLRGNLEDEELYGSTKDRRSERDQIIGDLNKLALDLLGISFNDLAAGKALAIRVPTGKTQALAAALGAGSLPAAVQPPVVTRLQHLPFNELNWVQFEALCAALVEAQGHVLHVEHYGVQGDYQQGIDIATVQRGKNGDETWVYQCKRYQEYTVGLLEKALSEITYPADYFVLMLSIEAKAALRDVAEKRPKTFLWDSRDLARKLKNFPDLVEDFFGKAWRQAFAGLA
jgi:restriction endonuclease